MGFSRNKLCICGLSAVERMCLDSKRSYYFVQVYQLKVLWYQSTTWVIILFNHIVQTFVIFVSMWNLTALKVKFCFKFSLNSNYELYIKYGERGIPLPKNVTINTSTPIESKHISPTIHRFLFFKSSSRAWLCLLLLHEFLKHCLKLLVLILQHRGLLGCCSCTFSCSI